MNSFIHLLEEQQKQIKVGDPLGERNLFIFFTKYVFVSERAMNRFSTLFDDTVKMAIDVDIVRLDETIFNLHKKLWKIGIFFRLMYFGGMKIR